MTTFGTNIFETVIDAVNYYRRQGFSVKDVYEKIRAKEILIGQDEFDVKYPVNEYWIDRDGRYHICEE